MLLVDKCRVNTFDDVGFNIELTQRCINLVSNGNAFPNMLIVGRPGCGKRTLVRLLVHSMYGDVKCTIESYVVSTQTYNVQQTPWHVEVNCNIDRNALLHIIKQHVKLRSMHSTTPYRLIVLHNAHYLTPHTQASLRCIMEQYHRTCRFIAVTDAPNRLLEPIRSRFLTIEVPSPLKGMLYLHIRRHMPNLDIHAIADAVEHCDGNARLAYWLLDGYSKNNTKWDVILRSQPKLIRDTIYSIFSTSTQDYNDILRDMATYLMVYTTIPLDAKKRIIQAACEYDIRLINTKRPIFHVEAFALYAAKELSLV